MSDELDKLKNSTEKIMNGPDWLSPKEKGTAKITNLTERFEVSMIKRLEECEEVLRFYSDRNSWKFESYKNDVKDVIVSNDLGCKSYSDEPDFACSSGGRRAREYFKKYEGKK
jgi:hypothetical protein